MASKKVSDLTTVTPLSTDLVLLDRPTVGAGAPITGKATLSALSAVIGGTGATSGTFNEPSPAEFVTTASLSLAGGEGFAYAASSVGTDTYFFVSGAIGGKNGASPGIAVFGGDIHISGSAGFLFGISGSLTKLQDGRSYLAAGTNITIVSESNGQIQISSAGGGGGSSYWTEVALNQIRTTGSVEQGQSTNAGAPYSHAEGYGTYMGSAADWSHVEGYESLAYGVASHAEGYQTTAGIGPSNQYSHTEGRLTRAASNYSHAEGETTKAYANGSHVEGKETSAGVFGYTLISIDTITETPNAIYEIQLPPFGYDITTEFSAGNTFTTDQGGRYEIVGSNWIGGFSTQAFVTGSNSYGYPSYLGTAGSGVVALITSSSQFPAFPQGTSTGGVGSHAEGYRAVSLGAYSHAEGEDTVTLGIGSHAEGILSIAQGAYSHTEGSGTIAQGDYSHAEGVQTLAIGEASHAKGYSTIASGTYSLAAGLGTISSGSGQTTVGWYNKRNNSNSIFIIGDGTLDSDAYRSDILRVDPHPSSLAGSGSVQITGSLHATLGLSGSLTTLTDGTSYLKAGSGVVIASQSNGPITIGSTIWEWNGANLSQFDIDTPVYNASQSGSISFGTGSLDVNKVSTSIDVTGVWAGGGGAIAYRVATSEGLTLPQRFRIRLGLGAISSGIRIGFMFYDPSTWNSTNLLGGGISFYTGANAIYLLSARGSAATTYAPFHLSGATLNWVAQFSDDYGETLCEWDCNIIPGTGGSKPGIILQGESKGSNGTSTSAARTIDRGMFIGDGNYGDAINAVFNNASLTGLAIVAVSTALGTYTAKITKLQILKSI